MTFRFEMRAALLILFLCLPAFGASVTIPWEPSTDSDVIGYSVYYGASSGHYTNRVSVGNVTSTVISGLEPNATYYFSATASDSLAQESGFSNEISYTTPLPPKAPDIILTITLPIQGEHSLPGTNWTNITWATLYLTNPQGTGYFRAGKINIQKLTQ